MSETDVAEQQESQEAQGEHGQAAGDPGHGEHGHGEHGQDAGHEAPSADGSGNSSLGAAGSIRPCPIPSGAVIFGELTSAFVDGPRLMHFLGGRRHTGAVVDAAQSRVQVSILHEGSVVALVAAGGEGSQRLDALHLPTPGGGEEHSLTVLQYRPEVAVAIGQLVNLPERFARMHGSFVDLPSLLSFLQREQASGGVRITTSDDTGVVLLRNGAVLGAYTRQKPELDDAEVVFEMARAHDAEVDVHVGSLEIPPRSVPVGQVVR